MYIYHTHTFTPREPVIKHFPAKTHPRGILGIFILVSKSIGIMEGIQSKEKYLDVNLMEEERKKSFRIRPGGGGGEVKLTLQSSMSLGNLLDLSKTQFPHL